MWRKVEDGKIMNREMLQYMGIVDEFNKDIHIKKICIEALEKRIQKKVKLVVSSSDDTVLVCPVCGEEVHSVQKFCHECGQALDWRV